jgi:tRNA pseudouridine38-40 synthase
VTNFRFVLEYDGSDFEGWQAQPEGHRTVQGCLGDALAKIVGGPVSLRGSGRTDAGVHAAAQVANARLETRLDVAELQRALNGTLPSDIAVLHVDVVPDAFDARRDTLGKRYRYRVWNGCVRSPLRERDHWWVRDALDLTAMRAAAERVRGEHDFASFQAAGSNVRTTRRTLTRADVEGRSGGEVGLVFEGDGFLRYMVRNLVGTLVEVGRGRLAAGALDEILAACDRAAAARTAPAAGLVLEAVHYADLSSDAIPCPGRSAQGAEPAASERGAFTR